MNQNEYKNKLAVRGQLSTADKLATLEYEMGQITEFIRVNAPYGQWPPYMYDQGLQAPVKEETLPPSIPPATPPVNVPPVTPPVQ